jgi:hypothetical protein
MKFRILEPYLFHHQPTTKISMKPMTESIIEDLVSVAFADGTAREKFLFRQSLHNLVRVAKAEQLVDIRKSVATLTGTAPASTCGSGAKIDGR